jgi:hypothetical protein
MKTIVGGFVSLLISALACGPAAAWGHANRWGGSTSHSWGSTSHTSAWGTSTSHVAGEGTAHTNVYGGGTAHAYGGGTAHTNMYGGTTAGKYGAGAWHTTPYGTAAYHPPGYHPPYYGGYYPAYHPPTTVNVYGSSCSYCGGWSTAGAAAAGAAVGLVAGAAIGSASANAASANAYSAGYAAGAANPTYAMGAIYATLPAGCTNPSINGVYYYLCGNTWFQPSYGANGVYYRVVPTP